MSVPTAAPPRLVEAGSGFFAVFAVADDPFVLYLPVLFWDVSGAAPVGMVALNGTFVPVPAVELGEFVDYYRAGATPEKDLRELADEARRLGQAEHQRRHPPPPRFSRYTPSAPAPAVEWDDLEPAPAEEAGEAPAASRRRHRRR